MKPDITAVKEQQRLNDAREAGIPWKKWGPYLSERQWGTVREDYGQSGDTAKFQGDPHWRDHLLFYEYFQGDNGAGLGASHQTGWTGLIARLIQLFAVITPESMLTEGLAATVHRE